MKCTLALFALAFIAAAAAYAYPSPIEVHELDDDSLWEPAGPVTDEHVTRFKRATCDLFSFQSQWVTPNHAACAAHCLVKGYKGGYCNNAICHCRN